MNLRDASGWQLILADLALILFLVTIAALAEQSDEDEIQAAQEAVRPDANIAPAQALFRSGSGSPSIAAWLESQNPDPRATLTVIASHIEGEQSEAWARARALAEQARSQGVAVRIVIQRADQTDLYASLAFDTPR